MKPAAVTIWLTLAAIPLLAGEKGTWEEVVALKRGRKVQIVLVDMKSFRGRLESVSEVSISLLVRQQRMRFEREDVYRVTVRGSRGKNALIGTAAGGLTGVVIGAIADRGPHESGEGNLGKMIFGGMGLMVGAGVGAAIPPGSTVFRSGRPSKRPPERSDN